MNLICVSGRLGGDIRMHEYGNGKLMGSFSLANNTGFGENKKTNWFKCTLFGKRATALQEYLVKGREVIVSGELNLSEYTNNTGEKRFNADIVVNKVDFIGAKKEAQKDESSEDSKEFNDDIPF